MKNIVQKIFSHIGSKKRQNENFSKIDSSILKDARRYNRFVVMQIDLVQAIFANTLVFPIVNFSYGGFALLFSSSADEMKIKGLEEMTLKLLGKSITTKVRYVYKKGNIAGFTFSDLKIDDIWTIKTTCQLLKQGESLHEIKKDHLKEKYKNSKWRCFRGEGPCDLLLGIHENQKEIIELLFTFFYEGYCELSFKDGIFKTSRAIDQYGVGARMAQTGELDIEMAKNALLILLGISEPDLAYLMQSICLKLSKIIC